MCAVTEFLSAHFQNTEKFEGARDQENVVEIK